jgi:hypothetical protein
VVRALDKKMKDTLRIHGKSAKYIYVDESPEILSLLKTVFSCHKANYQFLLDSSIYVSYITVPSWMLPIAGHRENQNIEKIEYLRFFWS